MHGAGDMKSWTAGQMFFVFDTEYCQNEEDDPKDAILYFYPLETTDTMRCTLCCQLMGICNFLKSCFSPVSLIRLGKGKFAVRAIQKYTLAIRGTVDMPDSVLQRQMDSLIELFQFHYCNFETVWKWCQGSRKNFLDRMTETWNILLPISQHAGNTLSLTFDLIPSIDLPKTAGLLFLQASQLLQACQRYDGVLAGCLMCDQRVLYTQLSTTVMHKLAFTRHKQKLPGNAVPVTYTLPGSVRLAYVYLDPREMLELNSAKRVAMVPATTTTGNGTISAVASPVSLTNGHAHPFEQHHLSTSSERDVQTGNGSGSGVSTNTIVAVQSTTAASSDTMNSSKSKPSIGEQPFSESLGSSVDESSGSEVAYESCPEFADDSSRSVSPPVVHHPHNRNQQLHKHHADTSAEGASDATGTDDDTSLTSSSSSMTTTTTATTQQDSTVDSSGCYGGTESSGSRPRSAAIRSTVVMEASEPLVLYVQEVNDTVLVLFMREECVTNPDTINAMWQLGVNTMTNLESDVKSCLEMALKKDIKSGSKYLYLQHDRSRKNNTGNVAPENDSRFYQQVFNRSVHLLHEDFVSDQHLYETTICSQNHVVYGHRLGARETYFQQQQQQQLTASSSSHTASHESGYARSGGSGGNSAEQGFPLQSDAVATVATKAKRRLERDQAIVLL